MFVNMIRPSFYPRIIPIVISHFIHLPFSGDVVDDSPIATPWIVISPTE